MKRNTLQIKARLVKIETATLLTPLMNQRFHAEDKQLYVHLACEVRFQTLDSTQSNNNNQVSLLSFLPMPS